MTELQQARERTLERLDAETARALDMDFPRKAAWLQRMRDDIARSKGALVVTKCDYYSRLQWGIFSVTENDFVFFHGETRLCYKTRREALEDLEDYINKHAA